MLRTEVAYDPGDESPAAGITVQYRREATLGLLVPVEMIERYIVDGGASTRSEIGALATYTKFRKFRASGRVVSPQ